MSAPTDFLRVSYSSLNLFSSCPRKFEFNKLYPRRARDFDTFAADVGTAMHKGYQQYLVSRSEDKALWALMESYPYEGEWNQDNDFRSLQACVVTLQEMIESAAMREWQVAHIQHPSGIIVPAIEVPFELRLQGIVLPDGRGIAITGFVDAFLVNPLQTRYRTMDIKTNRATTKDNTAKYKFDNQQVPYGIVLEHVKGAEVTDFTVSYLDCFIDLAEPRATMYDFDKDQDTVNEWLMNTVIKCQNIQRFMEMDYFPRTDGGCMFFNKPCYFLTVCELRDRPTIERWLLEGEAPEHREPDVPWVLANINVYGESAA